MIRDYYDNNEHNRKGQIMKKIILLCICVLVLFLSGCESCSKSIKHYKSSVIGIKRRVTLYSCNGDPIRTWEGRFMVELSGNTAAWIDDNNKEIKIAGMFVIEEL